MSWVLAGQVAALAAFILTTKVLATSLGHQEYGRFALGMTVPVLLNQFLFGPFTVAVTRYSAPYQERGLIHTMVAVIGQFAGIMTSSLFLAGVVISVAIGRLEGSTWGWLFLAALLFGLLQSLQGLFNSIQVATRRRMSAALHQALDPISRLVFGAAAVLLVSRSAEVATSGLAVGIAFVLLSQYYWLRKSLPPKEVVQADQFVAIRRTLWEYSRNFVFMGFFAWGQLASDRWSLKVFHGDSTVGIYSVVFQLASIPGVFLAGALAQFINPIVFQHAGDARNEERMASSIRIIRTGVVAMVALIGGSMLVSLWIGRSILVLFTSDAYLSGASYIPLVILGLGLMQIGHMLALVPLTYYSMRAYSVIKILHSIMAVGLNILGAWLYGIMGVSLSLVVSGILYVTIVALNNAHILRTLAGGIAQSKIVREVTFPG